MNWEALPRIKAFVVLISLRKKAGLLALLLEQSAEKMPTPAPRSKDKERRFALPVKITLDHQEIDEYEKEEMKKSRLLVKNKLSKWHY